MKIKITEKLSTATTIERLTAQIAKFYITTPDKINLNDNGRIIVNNKQMDYTRWTEYKNGYLFYTPDNAGNL